VPDKEPKKTKETKETISIYVPVQLKKAVDSFVAEHYPPEEEGKPNRARSSFLADLIYDGLARLNQGQQSEAISSKYLTFTITLETFEQKRLLEELARKNSHTPEEMLSQIVQVVLKHHPELNATSEIECRSFVNLLDLYLRYGELGILLRRFFQYLDENNRPTDADCSRIASWLGWEPEQVIDIRDRCISRNNERNQ
jgi:hypothetical protein